MSPAPGQGLALHLSDIHFNPYSDRATLAKLTAAPVEEWRAILAAGPTMPAGPGHDTDLALLHALLDAARTRGPYDYIINTGDSLAHDFVATYGQVAGSPAGIDEFTAKTLAFVVAEVNRAFPGTPMVFAFGNNDSSCENYAAPGRRTLEQLGSRLPLVAQDPTSAEQFAEAGYYVATHPAVADRDLVVLNSVLWSRRPSTACGLAGTDVGELQLEWLDKALAAVAARRRTATLVMHIPPGADAYQSAKSTCPAAPVMMWDPAYAERFLAILRAHPGVVRDGFAGHTHMDDFRVIPDVGSAGIPIRIGPAASALFRNRPGFSVVLFDRASGSTRDIDSYSVTSAPTAQPPAAPVYRFSESYPGASPDAEGLTDLSAEILRGGDAAARFTAQYALGAPSPLAGVDLAPFACAQTALTSVAYQACRCP